MMQLQKGQKVKLNELIVSDLFSIQIAIKMNVGAVDITCFGVDEKGILSDDRYFVFYNQTKSPAGEIEMIANNQQTCFQVQLKKLPSSIKKLVFTVAVDGNTNLQSLSSGSFKVIENKMEKAAFSFTGSDFQTEKAIILCEIYEKAGIWRVATVASGFNGGLSALLKFFGGEEIVPAAPVKEPKKELHIPPKVEEPKKEIPIPPKVEEPKKPAVVNLQKSGDSHKINLSKNTGTIHANLNWTQNESKGLFSKLKAIDLDLACMFRLTTGHTGVIQALGNSFGNERDLPFIRLDQDDRTGTSTGGENMFFSKPETIEFAVIFAYIYEGVPNWKNTNAIVTLKQDGNSDIQIKIDNTNANDRFCVIASLVNRNGQLEIKREEKYFNGHVAVDKFYGFGLKWKTGRK